MRYVLMESDKIYFLLMATRKSVLNNGKFDDLRIMSHLSQHTKHYVLNRRLSTQGRQKVVVAKFVKL